VLVVERRAVVSGLIAASAHRVVRVSLLWLGTTGPEAVPGMLPMARQLRLEQQAVQA